MRRLLQTLLPLLIFAGLVILLWSTLQDNPRRITSPLLNKPAPALVLPAIGSKRIIRRGIFEGKITLLNVFATWCFTCRHEHAMLNRIAASHQVQMIGLLYKDKPSLWRQWASADGNPYRWVLNDPHGRVAINWGVYGTPETFLIDQQGVVRDKIIGEVTPDLWRTRLLPEVKRLRSRG